MAKYPIMPLATDAYLADTTGLSAEEHGVYLLLLITAWRTPGCSLPDDDVRLARMARVPERRWRERLRPAMEKFWHIEGGAWTQKKQQYFRKRVAKNVEQKVAAANARWLKSKDTGHAAASEPHMQPKPKPKKKEEVPPYKGSPPPESEEVKPNGAGQATTVDIVDWRPDERAYRYAEEHALDPDRILQDIRDWAANAPASKRRKKDPHAFWQSWCRREADRTGGRPNLATGAGQRRGSGSTLEAVARGAASHRASKVR